MTLSKLVLGAALGALIVTPAIAGDVLNRVMANNKMVMSTDPEYPPQSSLDENNNFVGFDIDVGIEIAKRLGVDIEFVTPGWDIIVAGKWAGRWDLSVGSMTPTAARAEVLDFAAVYYYTPASIAVHEDSSVSDPAALSGGKIGVGVATTYEDYLKGELEIDAEDVPPFEYVINEPNIRTYDTDALALDDLRLGDGKRLDAAFTALPTINEAIGNGYPLKIIGEPLFREPLSVAVDKGDAEWSAKLGEIVAEMTADGTLSALSEKHYGADLTR